MKKGFLIAAVLLIAAGLALIACAWISAGSDLTNFDTAVYETNSYTVPDEFQTIDVRADAADVAFLRADGAATVVCTESETCRCAVSVENSTLRIVLEDSRKWYERISLFSKPRTLTVYLPSDAYGALRVETGTGDVSLPGEFSFDHIRIATGTGDVDCGAASPFGPLTVETGTGHIRLHDLLARGASLSVSTGTILAENVICVGTLSTTCSTGRTEITNVNCDHLTSAGSTGDLTLKDVIADRSISVTRSTGDVRFERCDARRITVNTSTGDVTGTLASGKTFVTKTSTGSVRVPAKSGIGNCEITTTTGDIEIRIAE